MRKRKNMHIARHLLLLFLLVPCTAEAETKQERLQHMKHDMLAPTVMVLVGAGTGSGSIIYSKLREKKAHSYGLTNFHVAKHTLVEQNPDEPTGERRRKKSLPIEVVVYHYGDTVDLKESFAYRAEIVADSEERDLALFRINADAGVFTQAATLAKKGTFPFRGDDAWTSGASLGLVPFLAHGLFGNTHLDRPGQQLIQTTAPVFFGSSGGGLYQHSERTGRFELVGVTSQFMADFRLGIPATHLSLSIGIKSVYEFLEEKDFGFIVREHNREPAH